MRQIYPSPLRVLERWRRCVRRIAQRELPIRVRDELLPRRLGPTPAGNRNRHGDEQSRGNLVEHFLHRALFSSWASGCRRASHLSATKIIRRTGPPMRFSEAPTLHPAGIRHRVGTGLAPSRERSGRQGSRGRSDPLRHTPACSRRSASDPVFVYIQGCFSHSNVLARFARTTGQPVATRHIPRAALRPPSQANKASSPLKKQLIPPFRRR